MGNCEAGAKNWLCSIRQMTRCNNFGAAEGESQ